MSSFSNRYFRSRLSLWRRLGCTGCISQSYEYFEISSDGEPQLDLLVLLYIIFLPDEAYQKLSNITISFVENVNKSINILLSTKNSRISLPETPEKAKVLLLTERVCAALVSLADSRENFYGSSSLKDDMKALSRCCHMQEKKLYHSLVLRVSERMILKKLRSYASQRGRGRTGRWNWKAKGRWKRCPTEREIVVHTERCLFSQLQALESNFVTYHAKKEMKEKKKKKEEKENLQPDRFPPPFLEWVYLDLLKILDSDQSYFAFILFQFFNIAFLSCILVFILMTNSKFWEL